GSWGGSCSSVSGAGSLAAFSTGGVAPSPSFGGSRGGVSSGRSGSFSSATPAHPPRSLVARFDRDAAEGRQVGRETLNGREKVPWPLSSPNSEPPRGAVQRVGAPAFSCRRGTGSPYSEPGAAGFSAT